MVSLSVKLQNHYFFSPFPLYSSPQLSPLSYHLSTSFSNTPLLLPMLPSLQSIPIPSKRKELHLQPPSSPSSPSLLSPCKQLCPLPTLLFGLPVPPQAPSFPSQPSPGVAGWSAVTTPSPGTAAKARCLTKPAAFCHVLMFLLSCPAREHLQPSRTC